MYKCHGGDDDSKQSKYLFVQLPGFRSCCACCDSEFDDVHAQNATACGARKAGAHNVCEVDRFQGCGAEKCNAAIQRAITAP